jgi:hypothetical protein
MRNLPSGNKKKSLRRVFFWTFVIDFVLVALGAHYIGLRHHGYGTFPIPTYEPLSRKGAVEFALFVALITSIWVTVSWSKRH